MTRPLYIKMQEDDNVAVAVTNIKAGTEIMNGVCTIPDLIDVNAGPIATGEATIPEIGAQIDEAYQRLRAYNTLHAQSK